MAPGTRQLSWQAAAGSVRSADDRLSLVAWAHQPPITLASNHVLDGLSDPSRHRKCGTDHTNALQSQSTCAEAQETVQIIGQGHSLSPAGRRVDISAAVAAAVAGMCEFPTDHMVRLPHGLRGRHATRIVVRRAPMARSVSCDFSTPAASVGAGAPHTTSRRERGAKTVGKR
jgi:hypothetical protein